MSNIRYILKTFQKYLAIFLEYVLTFVLYEYLLHYMKCLV